jgi:hypothetical protein
MARIKGVLEFVETTAAASITPPLPDHDIGNLLLVFVVADGVDTTFTTTESSAGWNIGGQQQSSGLTTSACRAGWFYKTASSVDELFVVNSTSTTWAATAICIEGAHASIPIDASNTNGVLINANPGVSVAFSAASIDTATINTLVFYTMFNSLSAPSPFPGVRNVSEHDTGAISVGIGMIPQAVVGATGTWDFHTEDHTLTTQNSVSFTIAIRDSATPTVLPAYLNKNHAQILTPFRGIVASIRGESTNATNTNIYTNMPALGKSKWKRVMQYDSSTATFYNADSLTTTANDASTGDFILFNNSPVPGSGDYVAFCKDTPFASISILPTTAGAGTAVFTWEVLRGTTWTAVTATWGYWVTTTLTNNTFPALTIGQVHSMILTPADLRKLFSIWKPSTLNGVTGYWMRCLFPATGTLTTNPTYTYIIPSEGISFYDAFANVADTGAVPFHNSTSSTPSVYATTVPGLSGTYWNIGSSIAPYTATGKIIIGTWNFGTPRDYIDAGARSELSGISMALIDSLWNERIYYIGGYKAKDTYTNQRGVYALQFDALTKTYNEYFNSVTNISKIGVFARQIRGAGLQYYSQCVAYGVPILSGGTESNPIINSEFLNTFAIDYYYPLPLIREGSCIIPLQLGGEDPLYLNLDVLLLTFACITTEPDAFSSEPYLNIHVDEGYLGLILEGSDGDVIKITNSVLSSVSTWRFEITEFASTSATYDFSGSTIINANVTLQRVVTFNSMVFSGCPSISVVECDLVNCTITNVPSTNDSFIT